MPEATQDWRTLGAGRELDALVAERVMGWGWMTRVAPQVLPPKRWLVPPEEYGDWGHVHPSDLSEEPEAPWWLDHAPTYPDAKVVPHYSTDMAAAWLVVEAMDRRGLSVNVRCERAGGPWSCSLWDPKDYRHVADEIHVGPAPLAICRAALAAVEVRDAG